MIVFHDVVDKNYFNKDYSFSVIANDDGTAWGIAVTFYWGQSNTRFVNSASQYPYPDRASGVAVLDKWIHSVATVMAAPDED